MKKFISMILCIYFICSILGTCYASEDKTYEIPIAMATDDNYVMPTLVSITSALKNSNKNTFLNFYILIPGDLSLENKNKFQKLSKNFKNCNITLIDMGEEYANSYKGIWGKAMYYRLALPNLLKNEKKCIYLDSDTLVLKDLQEFYNLNIDEYYLAGVPDGYRLKEEYAKRIGIKDMTNYICSGVLLWNLEKCRQDNIVEKFNEFISQKVDKENVCRFPDQDTINAVCYGKIYDLPFKFGAIVGFLRPNNYKEKPFVYELLSEDNWLDAKNNAVILHFVSIKPWNSSRVKYYHLWKAYFYFLKDLYVI